MELEFLGDEMGADDRVFIMLCFACSSEAPPEIISTPSSHPAKHNAHASSQRAKVKALPSSQQVKPRSRALSQHAKLNVHASSQHAKLKACASNNHAKHLPWTLLLCAKHKCIPSSMHAKLEFPSPP